MPGPRRTPSETIYSRGDFNRMIDSALHPLFNHSPLFVALDEAAHVLVEPDLRESVLKFIRYSVPPLIRKLIESVEE